YLVFRDYQNETQYYYQPSEKPKVANNGADVFYIVAVEGGLLEEGEDANDNIEGDLVISAELGPTPEEVETLRQELIQRTGKDNIVLAQTPFEDASVKLILYSFDSSKGEENTVENISIVGSTKPSMSGRQRATFSARLKGKQAQKLYWNLKDNQRAPIMVDYNFTYMGVLPAYNLRITVDFKAVDDFWEHNFGFDGSIEFGKDDDDGNRSKIALDADIDFMIQKLVNEGGIKIEQTNYQGEGSSDLLQGDATGIELVKTLLSPTLFQMTPVTPNQTALTESLSEQANNGENDADGGDDDKKEDGGDDQVEEPTPPGPNPGEDREENETDEGEDGGENEDEAEEDGEDTAEETEGGQNGSQETQDPPDRAVQDPGSEKDGNDEEDEEDEDAEKDEVDEVQAPRLDVKLGYKLRRREITQQIKRTYEFNKVQAKRQLFNPNGTLLLAGTAFDPEEQVALVRLGEGPFKEMNIEAHTAFDLDEYLINEVIVHISYGYKDEVGDETQRLHELSLTLTKDNPGKKVRFFLDDHRTMSFDYYVEFIHAPGSVIGTHETKITSRRFENVTERVISVNVEDHSPLIPVTVQPGNLQFSDENIRSVQVFLAPVENGNGHTTILNAENSEVRKYLIYPANEGDLTYYRRDEFFFQGETLVFEYDGLRDKQVIVNSPDARILNLVPTLVENPGLVQQALVDINYRNSERALRQTIVNLTPEQNRKPFAVLVDEDDPRNWEGRARFVLSSGDILEGDWINYDTPEPLINLNNSGFRVVEVIPLLGPATFNGAIAAVEVRLFDPENESGTLASLFLRSGHTEEKTVLRGVPAGNPVRAEVTIYRTDGSADQQEYVIAPGLNRLLLRITDIN
ncbi:MAG: hypothetical protein KDD15_15980, partial [Lewinella sp.]|nr:hypothetical protein [Lewinella sp.]